MLIHDKTEEIEEEDRRSEVIIGQEKKSESAFLNPSSQAVEF